MMLLHHTQLLPGGLLRRRYNVVNYIPFRYDTEEVYSPRSWRPGSLVKPSVFAVKRSSGDKQSNGINEQE